MVAALGNPLRANALHGIPSAPRREPPFCLRSVTEKTAQTRLIWATLIHSYAYDRRLSPLVKIQRAQLVTFKRAPTFVAQRHEIGM